MAGKKKAYLAEMDFGAHLRAVSQGRIELFFERKPELAFVSDWGHRHGQTTAYGETEFHDLGGLFAEEEEWP